MIESYHSAPTYCLVLDIGGQQVERYHRTRKAGEKAWEKATRDPHVFSAHLVKVTDDGLELLCDYESE